MPKLLSTYKTAYEERKAFLDAIHSQNCKIVLIPYRRA